LLGAQRADVGTIRAIWAVQDNLALSDEEETIDLKREFVAGQERTLWKAGLSLSPAASALGLRIHSHCSDLVFSRA
jgi:hypothetical protein